MINTGIDEETKIKIIGILRVLFPDVKIYLYGSRARGTHDIGSDIDLALVLPSKKQIKLGEARSILEALSIPYKIDLVDLSTLPSDMKEKILKEGILWNMQ